MASPKKVSTIKLTVTTIGDSDLPITELDLSSLKTFLNSVSSSNVAVFYSGDGTGNGSNNKLIIAAIETDGTPSSTVQFASAVLPCPPYCNE